MVLSISVLDRGSAIPVAWVALPHRGKGLWLPHLARLLGLLAPAVPGGMLVLVMTDRGLWSPRLWRAITDNGWHPLMRIRPDATFAPQGERCQRARELVPGPGCSWIGEGVAYKHAAKRIACTLVVVWGDGQKDPWLLLTDLPLEMVDGSWYGLRVWIELGFRALKSMGWHWERTRRRDPVRVARHWLVLAIATLLNLAVGTRLEDAAQPGIPPGRLRRSHTPPPPRARHRSVFARGLAWLHVQVLRGRRWGASCGCCQKRCPTWPRGSPSSVMVVLQEPLIRNTSPSQCAQGEGNRSRRSRSDHPDSVLVVLCTDSRSFCGFRSHVKRPFHNPCRRRPKNHPAYVILSEGVYEGGIA